MKKKLSSLLFVSAVFANQAIADCLITNATYIYDNNPSITAKFSPLKHKSLTNVYFTITSSKGQELWFTFDWGNGYTTERLVSSKTNPANGDWKPQNPDTNKDRLIADLDFYRFNKELGEAEGRIVAGENAPEYIFIPSLAPTLWYLRDASVFSDYQLKRAMFKLSKCEQ